MQRNEHQCVKALRKGDYQAFRKLYEAHAKNLKGFIFKLSRSESVADDITQETFIKVWLNHQSIDPDMSFKAYLFRISQNLLIDELRKNARNPLFEDYIFHCDSLSETPFNEEEIDFEHFIQQLQVAKGKLTPRQLRIFEMNKEQGIGAKEIAVELKITERSVYNHLYAAIQVLRSELSTSVSLMLNLLIYIN